MRLLGRLLETSITMPKFYQRDAEKLGISLGVSACSRSHADLDRSHRIIMKFGVDSHLQCRFEKTDLRCPCRIVDSNDEHATAN